MQFVFASMNGITWPRIASSAIKRRNGGGLTTGAAAIADRNFIHRQDNARGNREGGIASFSPSFSPSFAPGVEQRERYWPFNRDIGP